MKQQMPLSEFINDFKLRHIGKGVCFDAEVHFSHAQKNTIARAEVHIVRIAPKDINSIYLIHPDIIINEIPDMLSDHSDTFEYRKKECLVIKGSSKKYNSYTICIYPENNECDNGIFNKVKQLHK